MAGAIANAMVLVALQNTLYCSQTEFRSWSKESMLSGTARSGFKQDRGHGYTRPTLYPSEITVLSAGGVIEPSTM